MPDMTNPELLKMPLAKDGDKNELPETTGSTTGLFSQKYGFQEITQTPLTAGGKAPDRKDFNAAFNLLGGVSFFAQKGWTFHYDATQDYYKGCVVIDPADNNKYECIADMEAGTVAPSADTTHTYWRDANFLIREQTPAFNHRDVITTSGTYTAPVTGWYRITVKGGGAGGQGAGKNSSYALGGCGGGEGGTTIGFEYMEAGDTATVVIGAGGTGGAVSASDFGSNGTNGGDSSVTVNNTTYTGGGGKNDGTGGSGTITGIPGGGTQIAYQTYRCCGGTGGGAGGGVANGTLTGSQGGGGAGGFASPSSSTYTAGGAGGPGFAWLEFFDPTLPA